ncbi:MAG: hypothetical protein Tp170SUR191951_43 [Prokaryotic dsDNA virus sp.]|nr:hypothetical protein [Pseudomonas sp.]MBS67341.1 hypothetical protein [Pseudomonas sp.]QDP55205.1 MAG: hypothetical protein Tp170SUR191951_43 [Prokaryotic dsDNA virus sp.]|tara:strand:- start:787 stop:1929 length:1143 start_codon:yes stop_codon:yes gene_type:complete
MSDNLACARARKAAGEWLADVGNREPIPPQVGRASVEQRMIDAFMAGAAWVLEPGTDDEVTDQIIALLRGAESTEAAARGLKAYLGAIHREEQDHWTERFRAAADLIAEASALFRSYEAHHYEREMAAAARCDRYGRAQAAAKSKRNATMADKLEQWLMNQNPAEVLRQISLAIVDGETIKGIDEGSFDDLAKHLNEPVDLGPHGDEEPVRIDLPNVASREQAERRAIPIRRGQPEPSNVRPAGDLSWASEFLKHAHPDQIGDPKRGARPGTHIGRRVQKRSGDYDFDGQIRAVIIKRSGAVRYAVEDDRGLLLVMNAKQCGLDGPEADVAPARWNRAGVADLVAFRISTPDPLFDPERPVSINGYTFWPAQADDGKRHD